jgi:hypothetical protein
VKRVALALAAVAALWLAGAAAGTVWTDQSDYPPGSLVTISGDNANGAGYVAGQWGFDG